MFHFSDDVNWTQYSRFDKRWIENMNWARTTKTARAIFPVILSHCNECGESFPGEETIAALSGLTEKSVRKGIHDLEGFPGFDWWYYLTRRGKRGKRFSIKLPPKGEKGRSFFFYRGVMDGGIWCNLKSSAQALYPVMRHFARYDQYEDEAMESADVGEDFLDVFTKRTWELCSAEIGMLARYAGINRRSVTEALKGLETNFLIERFQSSSGEYCWKVFIKPETIWKAGFLNEKFKKRHTA